MVSAPLDIADATIAAATDNGRAPTANNTRAATDNGPATMTAAAGSDEVSRQRRRGAELEAAILAACVAELAEVGYGELTVESVATRAQTGKASIYRRWANKQHLVLEAVADTICGPKFDLNPVALDDSVTTRDALLAAMRQLAALMDSPEGDALRSVLSEALRDRSLAETFRCDFFDPRKQALLAVLQRGVDRGEVRPDAVNDQVVDCIAGTFVHRVLVQQQAHEDEDLRRMVDQFVLPAIAVR